MKITKESSKRLAEAKKAKKIARAKEAEAASKAMPPFTQIAAVSPGGGSRTITVFGLDKAGHVWSGQLDAFTSKRWSGWQRVLHFESELPDSSD